MKTIVAFAISLLAAGDPALAQTPPQTVHFQSLDGKTELTGYLFLPEMKHNRIGAVVMLHGRAGPYSSLAQGRYDATTLAKRHVFWGEVWARAGYAALLVDSFSARGYPGGFGMHSYTDRPEAVNEVTVRPLDAYGALRYLRAQPFVDPARIALQGWSNGGSAALAAMADVSQATSGVQKGAGFRGAVAFYPACGLHGAFDARYLPAAPVRIFSGDNDEEVSAAHCAKLAAASQAQGGDIAIAIYPGATHDFDDPGAKRQSVPENAIAAGEAIAAATLFVARLFVP